MSEETEADAYEVGRKAGIKQGKKAEQERILEKLEDMKKKRIERNMDVRDIEMIEKLIKERDEK